MGFLVIGTPVLLATLAVVLRHASLRVRSIAAALVLAGLVVIWAMAISDRQSNLAFAPALLGATAGSAAGAGLEAVKSRPVWALLASAGFTIAGFLVGMIISIEFAWLRP